MRGAVVVLVLSLWMSAPGWITAISVQLEACSGNTATIRCILDGTSFVEWKIMSKNLMFTAAHTSSGRNVDGIFEIVTISLSSQNKLQSDVTFKMSAAPNDTNFTCRAEKPTFGQSKHITFLEITNTADQLSSINYNVVSYLQMSVNISIHWEPVTKNGLYRIMAVSEATAGRKVLELISPPASLTLPYNVGYNLTVQKDGFCAPFGSVKYFQPGCDIPDAPVNGQLTGFISSQVGAQVTYECPSTRSPVVATCTRNLVWDPSSSANHCGGCDIDAIKRELANINVDVLPSSVNESVVLKCMDGYGPREAINVKCSMINATLSRESSTIINCSIQMTGSGSSNGVSTAIIIINTVVCMLLLFIVLILIGMIAVWWKNKNKKHHRQSMVITGDTTSDYAAPNQGSMWESSRNLPTSIEMQVV